MLRPEVADLKAEAARYHNAFIKANEAVTVREVAIARLTAERDRARDIAVALEGQVAAIEEQVASVRALAVGWAIEGPSLVSHASSGRDVHEGSTLEKCADELRAALDPDPADRGGEERP